MKEAIHAAFSLLFLGAAFYTTVKILIARDAREEEDPHGDQ